MIIEESDIHRAYIMRLALRSPTLAARSRSLPQFEKERYVLNCLEHLDFTPAVIPAGTGALRLSLPLEGEVEFGYFLQSHIPFRAAREKEAVLDRRKILRQLGAHIRLIHEVEVEGYGNEFDEATERFRHCSFADYVATKLESVEQSSISSAMKRWLSARACSLAGLEFKPLLYHRDLLGNWGNFLVDDSGDVRGIIDWEFAGSGAAFHFELASMVYVLTRDGASTEEIEHDLSAVLDGYGMSRANYAANYERDIETIVLLNSISALLKFDTLKKRGDTEKEPWRELFADRALALCHTRYVGDHRHSSV